MKKSNIIIVVLSVLVLATFAVAKTTGWLYGHALIIESIPGTTVASISTAGAATVVGLTNTGTLANVGALTNLGTVTVSTSATSAQTVGFGGAVVTLSTKNVTSGYFYYQVSDNKMYVSTKTISANDASCIATGCYTALW